MSKQVPLRLARTQPRALLALRETLLISFSSSEIGRVGVELQEVDFQVVDFQGVALAVEDSVELLVAVANVEEAQVVLAVAQVVVVVAQVAVVLKAEVAEEAVSNLWTDANIVLEIS